ncbi:MAG: hypothetical protein ABI743_03940 [bacterium]
MRTAWWALAMAASLTILGCSGGSDAPTNPVDIGSGSEIVPEGPHPALPSQVVVRDGVVQSAIGSFQLEIDPVALTAAVSRQELRGAMGTGDLYLLPLDSFLQADTFSITGVSGSPQNLDIHYRFAHPFPAPEDPTAPANGSSNRADLGVSPQILLLAEVSTSVGNSYFGSVVANTKLVPNPDGYYTPNALLNTFGWLANTFPYYQGVDEANPDAREGASNGGVATGNFGPEGWTRDELMNDEGGWTGYGILHQGQAVKGTISLARTALGTSRLTLQTAILAKYADPRGGADGAERKANRLPPATPNASLFAYRMPHGCWDISRITYLGESGGFYTNLVSADALTFRVTDWDARSSESGFQSLSKDPDVTHVAIGEAGLPRFAVCIPGVLGDKNTYDTWDPAIDVVDDDTAWGGDPEPDSGQPLDTLLYRKSVTKIVTTGQSDNTYTGLARAIDPELTNITNPSFVIELDADLAPVSGALPLPQTYQAFTVIMDTPNTPPFANVGRTSTDPLLSGQQPSASVTGITDADGDLLNITVNWGDGNGFVPVVSNLAPPYASQSLVGPHMNNTDLVNDSITMAVRVSDGTVGNTYDLAYTLGPNRPPVVAGVPALASSSLPTPATFTLNAGSTSVIDPEGNAVTYVVTGSRTPTGPFGPTSAFPITALGPYVITGTVNLTLFACDTLHQNLTAAQPDSASPFAAVTGTVNAVCSSGSLPGVGNISLATLTTGSVLRTGAIVSDAVITGIRITWSDIAGEGAYGIYRGEYVPGTPVANVSYTQIGEVGAGVTTFDNLLSAGQASGHRWIYRVYPRCAPGGADGPTASQVGIAALQDWEGILTGNKINTTQGGWSLLAECGSCGGQMVVGSAATGMSGLADLSLGVLGNSGGSTDRWAAVIPPNLGDADWSSLLSSFNTSRLEFAHNRTGSYNFGGLHVEARTSLPTANGSTPGVAGNTWVADTRYGSTQSYDSNATEAQGDDTEWTISAQHSGGTNFHLRSLSGARFSAASTATETITGNRQYLVIAAGTRGTGSVDQHIDNCAWLLY